MTTSVEQIAELYRARRMARAQEINVADEVRRAYNGDIALPLPELNRNERAAVANLMQVGIDQTSMRVSSTLPNLFCPSVKPGFDVHERRATTKRRALQGWMYQNRWELLLAKRARHLIAYAASPVFIREPVPGAGPQIPRWEVRNPLSAFPADMDQPSDLVPENMIFCIPRPLWWLQQNYPDQTYLLEKGPDAKPDSLFDVLEFSDAEERVTCVVGATPGPRAGYSPPFAGFTEEAPAGASVKQLERVVNRAGVPLAVMPGRVTLDRPLGQFHGMLGIFVKQARLAALEEIAIERGVFANEWFVEGPQGGEIIQMADGRQGIVGHVKGGTVTQETLNPGYKTDPAIDRLERAARVEGGIPADFGGEAASNVRTDRRGNSIMSATVDFRIAEAQKSFAASAEEEFRIGMAVDQAYAPAPKMFNFSWAGAAGTADYTPEDAFKDPTVFVRYPLPGTDVNGLTVTIGQMIGLGLMSGRTAMELSPLVDDPDQEHERIIGQELEMAGLDMIKQAASSGQWPPQDVARLAQLILQEQLTWWKAVQQVDDEAKARQSSTVAPVEPGSPEAQPGLAQPGVGAEGGVAPPAGLAPLSQMLRQMHSASTTPSSTPVPVA